MAQATTQALLRRAVELVGTKDLAIRLRVTQELLEAWMTGYRLMPDRKLRLLTDFLEKFDSQK